MSNAIMYTRVTGKSCEACLRMCLNDRALPNPYRCRAAVYDQTFLICDLFAVSGFRWPQFLSRYDNRDFYQPLSACDQKESIQQQIDAGPPAATPPPAPALPRPGPHRREEKTDEGLAELELVTESNFLPTRGPISTEELAIEELAVEETSEVGLVPNTAEEFGFGSTIAGQPRELIYEATDLGGNKLTQLNSSVTSIEKCDDGSPNNVVRFCKFENRELRGFSDVTLAVNSEHDCIAACAANEANQIQVINCHSFNYRDNQCVMSADDRETAGPIVKSEGVHYFEKQCYPADVVEGTSLIWTVIPDMILAGHVVEVTDAFNLNDCKIHCLTAKFPCISIMFYPEDFDQNCILNSKDRHTVAEKDAFGPETLGIPVFYVEIPRVQSSRRLKDEVVEQKSAGASARRWTLWSSCSMTRNGVSFRYLKCNERDIRKCPKDARKCIKRRFSRSRIPTQASNSSSEKEGPCLAVVDHRKQKRCPHGVKRLSSGSKVYCRNPVNCDKTTNE